MEELFANHEIIPCKDKIYVLIIYDIVNTKRRNAVVKELEGYGFRVQKSAFEALISEKLYNKLIVKLPRLIDPIEDSIRIYKFKGYGEVVMYGVNTTVKDEEIIIV